jgi:hypothetical protein
VGEPVPDILLSANPMQLKAMRAHYTLTLNRSFVSIGVNHLDEDYEMADTLDNRGTDVEIAFRRILSPRLTLSIDVGSLQRKFVTSEETTRDKVAGVQLGRQVGSTLFVAVRVESAQRTRQDDRMLYELRLTWRPHGNVRASGIGVPGPADAFALPRS